MYTFNKVQPIELRTSYQGKNKITINAAGNWKKDYKCKLNIQPNQRDLKVRVEPNLWLPNEFKYTHNPKENIQNLSFNIELLKN